MTPAADPTQSPVPVRCNHAVDRGDLLRLLRLGIPREEVGRLCGFALLDQAGQSETRALLSSARQPTPPPMETKVAAASQQVAQPLWRAIGPDLREPDPAERELPACLSRVEGTAIDKSTARDPSIVPPTPLAPTARLGSMLRRMLTVELPGAGVDAPLLVRLIATLRPIRRLPRKQHRAWTPRLQVYWDQAQALGPCLHDQQAVLTWLRRWRGEAGLECIVVPDSGVPAWYPNRRRGQRPSEAQPPRSRDAGTTVLALSDLGFVDGDTIRQERWSRLRDRAGREGAACHALVLSPRSRWQRALAQGWRAQPWDRSPGRGDSAQALEDLFLLLSPAIRIEVGLLRAARRLVAGGAADLGVELDAWRDSRVLWRAAALGMVLDAPQVHGLQRRFRALPEERRGPVLALLDRFHGKLSPNILAEEKLVAGDKDPRLLEVIASHAKGLVERGSHHGDLPEAVVGYLDRLVWRLPPEAWQHPELAALWGAAHRTRDGFAKPLPNGLEARQVLWALDSVAEPSWWLLFQRGPMLSLLPAAGLPATASLGSLLTRMRARLPWLEVRWHSAHGRTRKATLQVGRPFELPFSPDAPEVSRVELVGDLGRAEIILDSAPAWADRFWRDRHGLWVETTVRGFEWRMEESKSRLGRKKASLTVAAQDLTTRLRWPAWAKRLDKDPQGLFAELDLAEKVVTRMRWIPPGRFLMGSPQYENGRHDIEEPQHWVTLTQGFWLADTPCTQAEWRAVMGTEPSHFKGEDLPEGLRGRLPVEQVSWEDCQQLCEKLQARFPELMATLPSEAQWEYACRAGTASAFNDGSACTKARGNDPALARLGWFDENSGGNTSPVRTRARNPWGLYDMHGNVWEWCQDWLSAYAADEQVDPMGPDSGLGRVIRGGSWVNRARSCRSPHRLGGRPVVRNDDVGFRLASGQSGQDSRASQERADGKQAGRSPAAPVGSKGRA